MQKAFSSARNILGHPKKRPKSIKPLMVFRRAVHKHSLCYHSCCVSEYSCIAPCFPDASSVFLYQKLTSEGLSAVVITTKTLPTKASPMHLKVEPRRKWEFYLVNSVRTKLCSTVITILSQSDNAEFPNHQKTKT